MSKNVQMSELDKLKVFQALLHKFKDFQGLEFLFESQGHLSTFKFFYKP